MWETGLLVSRVRPVLWEPPHTQTDLLSQSMALDCTLESPGEIKNTNAQRLNLLSHQGNFFLMLPQMVVMHSQG